MQGIYIPPNGFIGAGSQTSAAQASLLGTGRRSGGATRRRRRKAASGVTKKRRSSGSRKSKTMRKSKRTGMRMVKGSMAARRYMAKIRKLRRK